ncbi:MAG: hypothetical protein P0S93_00550 [Candidatus Neptunochlamydia sp.]|nr:hypothetical protein [Candidatus Neptunochlamydia sp.]
MKIMPVLNAPIEDLQTLHEGEIAACMKAIYRFFGKKEWNVCTSGREKKKSESCSSDPKSSFWKG